MAFNTQYSDSGVFGMYMTGLAQDVPKLVSLAAAEFKKLGQFTAEEVSRAKNSLKGSIFMNSESSKLVMEDIGRQLIMSGKVTSAAEFAARVEKVTDADLKRVASQMLTSTPTYVTYGDTRFAPHYGAVMATLG